MWGEKIPIHVWWQQSSFPLFCPRKHLHAYLQIQVFDLLENCCMFFSSLFGYKRRRWQLVKREADEVERTKKRVLTSWSYLAAEWMKMSFVVLFPLIWLSFCVCPCWYVKKKNTFHLLKLWQPSVCVRLRLYLSLNRLYSLWITVKWEKEHFQVSFQPITAQRNHCCEEYCTQKDAVSVCVFHYFCFPPCFPRLWIWAVVPLKNPSFSLVFIDARRDGLVVHPGQRERGREGRKTHKRKGMKVAVNMRFNGWAIPSKLAASRQEFDAALVDCQTLIYEEMKRETRELEVARTQIDEERWREEKNKVKDMSHLHRSLPRLYFFLNEYLQSSSVSHFLPLWL